MFFQPRGKETMKREEGGECSLPAISYKVSKDVCSLVDGGRGEIQREGENKEILPKKKREIHGQSGSNSEKGRFFLLFCLIPLLTVQRQEREMGLDQEWKPILAQHFNGERCWSKTVCTDNLKRCFEDFNLEMYNIFWTKYVPDNKYHPFITGTFEQCEAKILSDIQKKLTSNNYSHLYYCCDDGEVPRNKYMTQQRRRRAKEESKSETGRQIQHTSRLTLEDFHKHYPNVFSYTGHYPPYMPYNRIGRQLMEAFMAGVFLKLLEHPYLLNLDSLTEDVFFIVTRAVPSFDAELGIAEERVDFQLHYLVSEKRWVLEDFPRPPTCLGEAENQLGALIRHCSAPGESVMAICNDQDIFGILLLLMEEFIDPDTEDFNRQVYADLLFPPKDSLADGSVLDVNALWYEIYMLFSTKFPLIKSPVHFMCILFAIGGTDYVPSLGDMSANSLWNYFCDDGYNYIFSNAPTPVNLLSVPPGVIHYQDIQVEQRYHLDEDAFYRFLLGFYCSKDKVSKKRYEDGMYKNFSDLSRFLGVKQLTGSQKRKRESMELMDTPTEDGLFLPKKQPGGRTRYDKLPDDAAVMVNIRCAQWQIHYWKHASRGERLDPFEQHPANKKSIHGYQLSDQGEPQWAQEVSESISQN